MVRIKKLQYCIHKTNIFQSWPKIIIFSSIFFLASSSLVSISPLLLGFMLITLFLKFSKAFFLFSFLLPVKFISHAFYNFFNLDPPAEFYLLIAVPTFSRRSIHHKNLFSTPSLQGAIHSRLDTQKTHKIGVGVGWGVCFGEVSKIIRRSFSSSHVSVCIAEILAQITSDLLSVLSL